MSKLSVVNRSEMELNPFVDEEKSNNGGGYSWPHITLELNNGSVVHIVDNSCGDFGVNVTVLIHDAEDKEVADAEYGELANFGHGHSTFDEENEEHKELLSIIAKEGYHVPTQQDFSKWDEEEYAEWEDNDNWD